MASNLKRFKARALARPGVKKAYDDLAEEFAFLDAVLEARAASGLSQAEVAARVGTTQSAIARLESAATKHSPSIATLRRCKRSRIQLGNTSGEEEQALDNAIHETSHEVFRPPLSLGVR